MCLLIHLYKPEDVKNFTVFICLEFSILAQRLRNDATAIRNRKKIIELIKQRPEVNRNYCWDIVYHEAEAQSETFLIRYLVDKVSL